MNRTLKFIAMALALGVVGSGAALAEQVKVGFAAEPYPPFTSPDA
jgi:polar amino acid transport system substrate-binding protein